MRVPLTVALETWDGTSAKDQRVFNGIAEAAGEQFGVIKRPGSTYRGAISAGTSKMLAQLSGKAIAVTNDSVKTVTPYPFVLESTSSLSPITAGLDLTSAVKGQGDNVQGDELKLIAGSLEELQHWPHFMEKFGVDMTPATIAVMFTVNIPKSFVSTINGCTVVFGSLTEGLCWNELIDLAALEKGDFKGQGPTDKIVTVFNALKGNKYKYPEMSVEEALKTTNNAKREVHGAV